MSVIRRSILAGLVALPLTALPAFAQDRLRVVATTGMIADAAREVGRDLVEVQALMGPGVDPHGYRQTRSDIVALANADLVVWHGLFLEAQLEELLDDLDDGGFVRAVAGGVSPEALLADEEFPDRPDPHLWMDPARWALVVGEVREALTDARPDESGRFDFWAREYLEELELLDAYAQDVLATVPEDKRVLLTAHDAFGYFGDAYDFEVIGIQGISTESEAGVQRIGELVDLLVSRDIGAVFVESSVSDRNIRALIEGAAAQDHEVVIGGALFSDAMGPDGSYEGTYIGMIDHNVTAIARALGGDAPEDGMSGQLGGS